VHTCGQHVQHARRAPVQSWHCMEVIDIPNTVRWKLSNCKRISRPFLDVPGSVYCIIDERCARFGNLQTILSAASLEARIGCAEAGSPAAKSHFVPIMTVQSPSKHETGGWLTPFSATTTSAMRSQASSSVAHAGELSKNRRLSMWWFPGPAGSRNL
jgi:hypothetical protein